MVAFAEYGEAHDDLVGLDAPCHVEATDHAAEDRVLAVEVGGGSVREKELAPAGVGAWTLGHGKGAREVIASAVARVFIRNPVAGPAFAGRAVGAFPGVRIAGLCHEIRQDPVELYPLVVVRLRQRDEVGHGIGSLVLEKLHHDSALFRDQLDPRQVVGGRLVGADLLLLEPQFRIVLALTEQRLDLCGQ